MAAQACYKANVFDSLPHHFLRDSENPLAVRWVINHQVGEESPLMRGTCKKRTIGRSSIQSSSDTIALGAVGQIPHGNSA